MCARSSKSRPPAVTGQDGDVSLDEEDVDRRETGGVALPDLMHLAQRGGGGGGEGE